MAAFTGIRSVGNSIVAFLNARWDVEPMPGGAPGDLLRDNLTATIDLVSSGELAGDNIGYNNKLTLWLYRVSVNEQLRNRARGGPDSRLPMHVDLHYLLTVWADTADTEHQLIGWALRTLQDVPILDASILSPDGLWRADEVVHLTPEELSNEDMLRLWDALEPKYRLSYSYVARVVSMEPTHVPDVDVPVVARHIDVSDEEL
jgi:hypothetical protein